MRLVIPHTAEIGAGISDTMGWQMPGNNVFIDRIVLASEGFARDCYRHIRFVDTASGKDAWQASPAQLLSLYGVPHTTRIVVPLEIDVRNGRDRRFQLHFATNPDTGAPGDDVAVAADVLQQHGLHLDGAALAAILSKKRWPTALHASLELLVDETARRRMA